ncbi:MAG: hypothetical protein A3E84_00555 [Gammaproteobacteria bacterium RIFCSPHIGHO2_12_FULL_42_13]|nr:MAG: hypothetical protein A3E84_00555 [Gammaproteobacteria bacterium RIFCSPHIGHO2_12_FULL_42_13]
MKMILSILFVLFGLLQYEFWFSDGGMRTVWKMQHEINQQKKINAELDHRNQLLIAEIDELQNGTTAIESHARSDLGMVKKGEVFYRIVQKQDKK